MRPYSLAQLARQMASGKLTARCLTESYLERIEQIDRRGPRLNSIIETNPEALATAEALDAERQEKGPRGPLHGIPIVIKENIDTADQMSTTAGSLALLGSHAPQDAFLVQRLRQAGAIILAKANLSEWANFRSTHSSSGWSSRGGQTRNPYALDRNPCGSSSGSAVAVAANLCAAAVGTETDGSIICPSQTNGIVGLKPTLGLVSRAGVIPIAHSQDTAGPMARSVADVAILLGAMTGVDPRDPATAASAGNFHSDYTQFLKRGGLKGVRLGVARNYFGFDARVDAIMETCLAALKKLGAELIDPANIETEEKFGPTELDVLYYEFKHDLNAYLASLGAAAPVKSLAEIIAFNEGHKDTAMPYFGQERMLEAEKKGPLSEEAYQKALENNLKLSREDGIDKVLREHKLDAILAPAGGPAWLTDLVNGDHSGGGGSSSAAAVAGYPNITVPAGHIFGLPVGISFFASAWQEPVLLRIAHAFERATQARQQPRFLKTAIL